MAFIPLCVIKKLFSSIYLLQFVRVWTSSCYKSCKCAVNPSGENRRRNAATTRVLGALSAIVGVMAASFYTLSGHGLLLVPSITHTVCQCVCIYIYTDTHTESHAGTHAVRRAQFGGRKATGSLGRRLVRQSDALAVSGNRDLLTQHWLSSIKYLFFKSRLSSFLNF